MANPLLEVRDIDAAYGDAQALWQVSLAVPEGAIVALVGANGAGKTTLLKTVSGLLRPRGGSIRFKGQAIERRTPQAIVAAGLCHVPEGRGLFSRMTVLENLELGAYPAHARGRMRETLERVFALFPRLSERRQQKAGLCSGGEQQMLAIGRAIMAHPALLVLDEPSMGLSPRIVRELFALIRTLNEQGVTILLVEQNVHQALQIADQAFVLQSGRIAMQGSGRELLADPAIQEAYIGSLGATREKRA